MAHFIDRAIQLVAHDKIQTAIRDGVFDRLPGLGEPLDLLDQPLDENWWVRSKAQDENINLPRLGDPW
jgi:hypothetical protein